MKAAIMPIKNGQSEIQTVRQIWLLPDGSAILRRIPRSTPHSMVRSLGFQSSTVTNRYIRDIAS